MRNKSRKGRTVGSTRVWVTKAGFKRLCRILAPILGAIASELARKKGRERT